MQPHLTEIPINYPLTDVISLKQAHMLTLLNHADDCASQGLPWKSIHSCMDPCRKGADTRLPACPAASLVELR